MRIQKKGPTTASSSKVYNTVMKVVFITATSHRGRGCWDMLGFWDAEDQIWFSGRTLRQGMLGIKPRMFLLLLIRLFIVYSISIYTYIMT